MLDRILAAVLLGLCAALVAASPAAAAPAYDPDTVIVKYSDRASALDRLTLGNRVGLGEQLGKVRRVGAAVVAVDRDPAVIAKRLKRSALVEYAETNKILTTSATPDDPRFGELYGLHNTGQTGGTPDADIDAPEGWDAAGMAGFPSNGGPRVGIVDTGIQQSHPDLSGKVAGCAQSRGLLGLFAGSIRVGSCADDNGHGTHVAGTVSANASNGTGVAGVAFDSPLVICRALGGVLGSGTTADVANCITWVHDQGAKVISMSLGGGNSQTLQDAVDYAWKGGGSAGSVLIAAAGNDGNSTVNYPAGYGNVVSVAATDHDDARASFSNANSDVEIAGPGVDVLSTYNDGSYATLSGTSMATPHVSGVAAVIRKLNPSATAAQAVTRLDSATDDLGSPGRDSSFGHGRVNLQKAASG